MICSKIKIIEYIPYLTLFFIFLNEKNITYELDYKKLISNLSGRGQISYIVILALANPWNYHRWK